MRPRGLVSGLLFLAAVAYAQETRAPSQATLAANCDEACWQAKIDRQLMLMGELGNEESLQASLREVSAGGAPAVRIVHDMYNRWTRLSQSRCDTAAKQPEMEKGMRMGEMRWRAVHLLGTMGAKDAVPVLHAIARTPLPDPRCDEQAYADEYRIRLRAIAGLENLKAVDELKQLYEIGGVWQNPTAASLFVLGVNVGNVRLVDAKTALAEDVADAKDYNPNRGRAAQKAKPGSPRTDTKRREDTPAIRKQQ